MLLLIQTRKHNIRPTEKRSSTTTKSDHHGARDQERKSSSNRPKRIYFATLGQNLWPVYLLRKTTLTENWGHFFLPGSHPKFSLRGIKKAVCDSVQLKSSERRGAKLPEEIPWMESRLIGWRVLFGFFPPIGVRELGSICDAAFIIFDFETGFPLLVL